MIEAMKQARQIIWRYRHETPLGNQPHMIAHEADETIERIDQAIATEESSETQEPVAWRVRWTDGSMSYRDHEPSDACKSECEVKALYIHPQPKAEQTN